MLKVPPPAPPPQAHTSVLFSRQWPAEAHQPWGQRWGYCSGSHSRCTATFANRRAHPACQGLEAQGGESRAGGSRTGGTLRGRALLLGSPAGWLPAPPGYVPEQWQMLWSEVPKQLDALVMVDGNRVQVIELLWVPIEIRDDKAISRTWVLNTSTYPCILLCLTFETSLPFGTFPLVSMRPLTFWSLSLNLIYRLYFLQLTLQSLMWGWEEGFCLSGPLILGLQGGSIN